jgi:hypothetical protein
MRTIKLAWIPAILFFAGAAFGQISTGSNLPFKELIFPQVAAGGQYQTSITVTNRGTQAWSGTFNFYTDQGTAWNPYVGGIQVSGGSLAVTVAAKATATFTVTVPGSTEAGYMIARTSDTSLSDFLEGNLTYYVIDNGAILDAVGIVPSNPILGAAIPVADFTTLVFAFANTSPEAEGTATITLTPYSATNTAIGKAAAITLTNGTHIAEYLTEAFPGISGSGRVEIQSNIPVSGVALTQQASPGAGVPGQLSSLPLDSTTRTYAVSTSSSEVPIAKMTLWTNGLFVNGYVTMTNSTTLYAVVGQIASDGTVHLHFDGMVDTEEGSYYIFVYITTSGTYTPTLSSFTGNYYAVVPSEGGYYEPGTFNATLVY